MRYLRSASIDPESHRDYAFELPAVRALDEIEFGAVTVLVGDNGTGKSTLVEALAVAAGFNAEGGGKNLRFTTYATHSMLSHGLVLTWDRMPKWGWFLRAETFYGMVTHIVTDGLGNMFPDLHGRSHGESFLELIEARMRSDGLYLLDEPESALSFGGQLRMLRMMHEAIELGAQFVVATHSPLLMAYPDAVVYQLDQAGARRVGYDEIESVTLWRSFLADPARFFHHLFQD